MQLFVLILTLLLVQARFAKHRSKLIFTSRCISLPRSISPARVKKFSIIELGILIPNLGDGHAY